MYDDDAPVTPLADWRAFWGQMFGESPEEQTEGPTEQEFEAHEAIAAAEWPQLKEDWLLAFNYTTWDLPQRSLELGAEDEEENIVSVRIDSPALRSHLKIEVDENRLRFIAVSQDELPVQALDVNVWRSWVTDASKAARSPKEKEWYAVIGTEPLGPFDHSDQLLTQAASVANLTLKPLGPMEEEWGIADLGENRNRSFTPILVQGICRNWHDWGSDAEEEAIEVRRLCGLLSVAWNGCWSVKLLPKNYGLDELDLKPAGEIETPDPKLVFGPVTVSVEPWMSAAFQSVAQDRWLSNALAAFHEGMLLYKDHPSIALLAFVTCCETIGQRISPNTKPSQQFQAALRTVLTEDETVELKQAYDHRNNTAHEGRMHGFELSYGLSRSMILSRGNPGLEFTGSLRSFRNATRDVLLHALNEPGSE